MTDLRFDGSGDAPPARGSLCVEVDCGKRRADWVHYQENPAGHFFNSGDPLIGAGDRVMVRGMPGIAIPAGAAPVAEVRLLAPARRKV
ncbi:MAG: hypothetical protein WA208_07305, partial [Thermoanaerobaculia bacterium]